MTRIQSCPVAGMPKACMAYTRRVLFTLAPAGPDLALLSILEVLLWMP